MNASSSRSQIDTACILGAGPRGIRAETAPRRSMARARRGGKKRLGTCELELAEDHLRSGLALGAALGFEGDHGRGR
jgi:hypothetical protein